MTVGIASDHWGVEKKENLTSFLKKSGYNIIDYGTSSTEKVDYPEYAFTIGENIRDGKIDYGILICGTGIGMSIACNKVKKVRCAKVDTVNDAIMARRHNNANVIAIGSNNEFYQDIVIKFLTTEFSNEERHIKRNQMIDNY